MPQSVAALANLKKRIERNVFSVVVESNCKIRISKRGLKDLRVNTIAVSTYTLNLKKRIESSIVKAYATNPAYKNLKKRIES